MDSTIRSAGKLAGLDDGRGAAGAGAAGLAGGGPGHCVEGGAGGAAHGLRWWRWRSSACRRRWCWPAWRSACVFALVRIVWLIVAAVFLYDITVETGQFEVMKASIARLSADRRLQAVLVAFCFGALIEGAAGFGRPVAISAAFLVGLGFRPFQAALALPDRQHGAGGLGRHRHPDPHPQHGHRAGRPGPERHVRPDPADPLAGHPLLAGGDAHLVAQDLGGPVPAAGHRRDVRGRPVRSGRTSSASSWWTSSRRSRASSPAWSSSGSGGRGRSGASRATRDPADAGGSAGRTDRRTRRAGLDAVRAADGIRAGLGHPGVEDRWGPPRSRTGSIAGSRGSPSCPGCTRRSSEGAGGDRPRDAHARGPGEGPARDRPALLHGHGRLPGGAWPAATCSACRRRRWPTVRADGPPHGPGDRGDPLHAGAGVRDEVRRDGRGARPGVHADRADCSTRSSARCWAGWASR